MSEEIKNEVIEELDFVEAELEEAVETEEKSESTEVAVTEKKESFMSKFKSSAKEKAPKVAKFAAIGVLTIAGFMLGVKAGKKVSELDGDDDCIDCDDYEVLDDDYSSDGTNE